MVSSHAIKKMIEYSQGNHHDINHLMKVHGFAQTIARLENCSLQEQEIIEVAAIIHDIACPLCRKKYGNTNGKYQEAEGMILAREFLQDLDLSDEAKERIVYLVGHHHTLQGIDGLDYQILIEADYLVNADESHYSRENIENMYKHVFKTPNGKSLLQSIYLE
ncbi:HD domain-containing protein [Erysipelotrichaceae bacterium 51-3]